MKLVMTLLVRDEEDILQANLDYHLGQGVDFVVATDHGSVDGTAEILARYEAMGVAHVLRAQGEEHHQSQRVTAMARMAATRFDADWIINNDADEFWWPAAGTLKDVLAAVPASYGQLEVQRRNVPPQAPGPGAFYERMVHRELESQNRIGRPLEPKVAHRASAEVDVAPGNHSIEAPDLRPAPQLDLLEILHYPARTYEQFERKVLNVGIGYETLPSRSGENGRDQLELLEIFRAGGLRALFDEMTLEAADIDEGLRSGRLVLDRRLQRFLGDEREADTRTARPDSATARRLVGGALALAAQLDECRARLEDATRRAAELDATHTALGAVRRELDGARDELEALRAQHATDRAALEQSRVALEETGAALEGTRAALDDERAGRERAERALEVVRRSRIMRCTAPARRLYYRLRRG